MIPKLITERFILREIKANDIFGYSEILSDSETMKLFGGQVLTNDLDNKDFVQRMKSQREEGISYFWSITTKEDREFIGFIRLLSYNSFYFDASFSSLGAYKNNPDFLVYFDRVNGWEIDYALIKSYWNKGIMTESVGAVIEFCKFEKLSPIYAKVNSLTNTATVKVLKHYNFQEFIPQVTNEKIEKNKFYSIVENNQIGMIFKWSM